MVTLWNMHVPSSTIDPVVAFLFNNSFEYYGMEAQSTSTAIQSQGEYALTIREKNAIEYTSHEWIVFHIPFFLSFFLTSFIAKSLGINKMDKGENIRNLLWSYHHFLKYIEMAIRFGCVWVGRE